MKDCGLRIVDCGLRIADCGIKELGNERIERLGLLFSNP